MREGNRGTYSRALDDINARGVSGGNDRRFPFPGGRERGAGGGDGADRWVIRLIRIYNF
jgi:hypothetical protein